MLCVYVWFHHTAILLHQVQVPMTWMRWTRLRTRAPCPIWPRAPTVRARSTQTASLSTCAAASPKCPKRNSSWPLLRSIALETLILFWQQYCTREHCTRKHSSLVSYLCSLKNQTLFTLWLIINFVHPYQIKKFSLFSLYWLCSLIYSNFLQDLFHVFFTVRFLLYPGIRQFICTKFYYIIQINQHFINALFTCDFSISTVMWYMVFCFHDSFPLFEMYLKRSLIIN